MIDSHCHLEQKEYEKDRDSVVEECKKAGLKAVITSCANPKDFDLSLEIVEKHKGFVYLCTGLHPEYIKEISEKQKDEYLDKIKANRKSIVALGEVGLDFHWVKEKDWQEKQKDLLVELIGFSREIKKPLVIHSRDAGDETFKVLEAEDAKKVLLHFFTYKDLVGRLVENNWSMSVNLLVTRNKTIRKIVKSVPLENIMLETDAPWLGPQKPASETSPSDIVFFKNDQLATLRNDSTTIKQTAEKIAGLKGIGFSEVWEKCGSNAERFFCLKKD